MNGGSVFGFFLPAACALASFFLIVLRNTQNSIEKRYAQFWILSCFFGVQSVFTGWGGWADVTDQYSQIFFISLFPIIVFSYFYYTYSKSRRVGLPVVYIDVHWLCLGTFSSAAVTDFLLAYAHVPGFRFSGLGGAGYLDGLFIGTLFPVLMGVLLNRLMKSHERSRCDEYVNDLC